MISFSTFSWLLLLCGTGLGAVIPDVDPFYQPPSGFEASPPGTVYKNRGTNSGMLGVTATQILYRTTDAIGNPAATVATILQGIFSSPSKLVIYNPYEDAANTTCSPSYLFTTNNPGTAFGPTFGSEVSAGLGKGWTIVIADYEGFHSAFSAGRLEGKAALDALRAVKGYAPAGISANAVLGGYGYSGGAIATGWAAALHPTYAPELNIKGWAFGGTPADVKTTLLNVDGTFFAGFAAAGIAGMMQAYPQILARFAQISTDAGAAAISKVLSQCALANMFSFLGTKFLSTQYQTLGANILTDPVIASVLALGVLGSNRSETPTAPVYMYHGAKDEVIPYNTAQSTAATWCSYGAQVTFVTETGGAGHLGTEFSLYSDAVDWLDARITGTPLAPGCSNINIDAGGLPVRRGEGYTNIIERFGEGDSKVIARMLDQHKRGVAVDSFWSYLRN